ncbi:MAG: hypothetical protein PHN82_04700 [bacterium]|nr:hypothetical protein [bacterium]
MKKTLCATLVLLLLAASSAFARPRHHRHGYRGRYRPGCSVPAIVGSAIGAGLGAYCATRSWDSCDRPYAYSPAPVYYSPPPPYYAPYAYGYYVYPSPSVYVRECYVLPPGY